MSTGLVSSTQASRLDEICCADGGFGVIGGQRFWWKMDAAGARRTSMPAALSWS